MLLLLLRRLPFFSQRVTWAVTVALFPAGSWDAALLQVLEAPRDGVLRGADGSSSSSSRAAKPRVDRVLHLRSAPCDRLDADKCLKLRLCHRKSPGTMAWQQKCVQRSPAFNPVQTWSLGRGGRLHRSREVVHGVAETSRSMESGYMELFDVTVRA